MAAIGIDPRFDVFKGGESQRRRISTAEDVKGGKMNPPADLRSDGSELMADFT